MVCVPRLHWLRTDVVKVRDRGRHGMENEAGQRQSDSAGVGLARRRRADGRWVALRCVALRCDVLNSNGPSGRQEQR